MNKKIYLLLLLVLVFVTNSCYDRDVLDSKGGVQLPPVSNLASTLSGSGEVTVTWTNPTEIPSEFERPLSVYMQVYRGTVLEYQIALEDEPTRWEYTLEEPTESNYRIVVKMYGFLKNPEYGKSGEIYSPGQTVTVK
ncbi:MAG: DUF4945 domain-containing protein [Tannerellaceae bacterium]|nr:DUF4945 domain-containing protein [Tannerellaceae bacterium]